MQITLARARRVGILEKHSKEDTRNIINDDAMDARKAVSQYRRSINIVSRLKSTMCRFLRAVSTHYRQLKPRQKNFRPPVHSHLHIMPQLVNPVRYVT